MTFEDIGEGHYVLHTFLSQWLFVPNMERIDPEL